MENKNANSKNFKYKVEICKRKLEEQLVKLIMKGELPADADLNFVIAIEVDRIKENALNALESVMLTTYSCEDDILEIEVDFQVDKLMRSRFYLDEITKEENGK